MDEGDTDEEGKPQVGYLLRNKPKKTSANQSLIKKDRILLPAVFTLSAAYYLIYYDVGIILSDEGAFLNSTMSMLDGKAPYRDFLYYPPFLNYVMAFIFKVFGVNLLFERLLWIVIISASVVLSYLISRRLMPPHFSYIPPLLTLVIPGPWHKSVIPFVFLMAGFLGSKYQTEKRRLWVVVFGLFAGLIFHVRFDTSVFIIIAFVLLIFMENLSRREVMKTSVKNWISESSILMATYLVCLTPAAIFLASLENRGKLIPYIIYRIVNENRSMGVAFPKLDFSLMFQDFARFTNIAGFYFPFILVPSILLMSVWRFKKGGSSWKEVYIIYIAILGVFAFNQTIVRSDLWHLLHSIQIYFILGVYVAWEIYNTCERFRPVFLKVAVKTGVYISVLVISGYFAFGVIETGSMYSGSIGVMEKRDIRLNFPRGHVYLNSNEASGISGLISFIKSRTVPGEYISVLPYAPMIYFLTETRTPTYFDAVFPATFATDEMQKSFIRELEKHKVRTIVLTDQKFTEKEESRFKNYARSVYGYIVQNYAVTANFGEYEVLSKKDKKY